jgi:hypothetical protein
LSRAVAIVKTVKFPFLKKQFWVFLSNLLNAYVYFLAYDMNVRTQNIVFILTLPRRDSNPRSVPRCDGRTTSPFLNLSSHQIGTITQLTKKYVDCWSLILSFRKLNFLCTYLYFWPMPQFLFFQHTTNVNYINIPNNIANMSLKL